MKKKEAQSESSIKIALKVKSLDRVDGMIKVLDQNHIKLVDDKTRNSEEFEYDRVFDMSNSNQDVYNYVKSSTVGRVFDNTNCCVISIGQASSGKSFSLFGNDTRLDLNSLNTDYSSRNTKNLGLVQKIYQGLVESSADFQDNKEYQIIFNMVEVHKESVRDLLGGFEDFGKTIKVKDDPREFRSLDNLEVYESANGQLMIKNLTSLYVESEETLISMMAHGLRLRLNNAKALGYDYPTSHIVMNMNFLLRDKENYNFPSLNATVQFVEVACHERLSSTLNDLKKFQDSLTFNAQISALQKVLLGIHLSKKSLPYKDSKLTKILQNCCNVNSDIVILCHAISNPKEFIACLSYMNLVARFRTEKKDKQLAEEVQRVAGELKGEQVTNSLTAAEEKVVSKMKDDIRQLDARFEYFKKEYRNNFAEIASIIGAKENLEALIYKKQAQFWNEFREKKLTLTKIEAKDKQLTEKELQIIKTQKKIEELKREINDKLEQYIVQNYQFQDELNFTRDQARIVEKNRQEFERESMGMKHDKINQLVKYNRALLDTKSKTLSQFPKDMLDIQEPPRGQTAESLKTSSYQQQKQKNDEMLAKLKQQNKALIEAKQKEFEAILALKNEESVNFQQRCMERKSKKK